MPLVNIPEESAEKLRKYGEKHGLKTLNNIIIFLARELESTPSPQFTPAPQHSSEVKHG